MKQDAKTDQVKEMLNSLSGKSISQEEWEKYEKFKKRGPEVIIIHESFWEGIISDVWTFVIIVGIISVGSFLQSSAMQWAGFLMLAAMALTKVLSQSKKMTIAEARTQLDKIEAESK